MLSLEYFSIVIRIRIRTLGGNNASVVKIRINLWGEIYHLKLNIYHLQERNSLNKICVKA